MISNREFRKACQDLSTAYSRVNQRIPRTTGNLRQEYELVRDYLTGQFKQTATLLAFYVEYYDAKGENTRRIQRYIDTIESDF